MDQKPPEAWVLPQNCARIRTCYAVAEHLWTASIAQESRVGTSTALITMACSGRILCSYSCLHGAGAKYAMHVLCLAQHSKPVRGILRQASMDLGWVYKYSYSYPTDIEKVYFKVVQSVVNVHLSSSVSCAFNTNARLALCTCAKVAQT